MLQKLKGYKIQLIIIAVLALTARWAIYSFDVSNFDLNEALFDGLYSGTFLKALAFAAFILLFLPERVYRAWRWFALLVVPLAIWEIITPIHVRNWGYFTDKSLSSDLWGYLLLLGTLSIILWVSVRHWWGTRAK